MCPIPTSQTAEQLPDGFETLPVFRTGESITGVKDGVLGPNGIRAYRHTDSAVRVVIFDAPGPLVSATMVINTQPISDAGHPHTLEHIIFLGSRNHPRRGYLDNLAYRCLADGTNAWTDNEFTAYTTTTAGVDGMLLLLPVYLDHVLRPVINAAAFASEVYHVRADGKEAGVVFCEMQARENLEGDVTDRALRSAILPNTPLALESGGLCASIRTLTNESIAKFHRDQYCGANVTVVIGGSNVPAHLLLSSVKGLLDEIAKTPGFEPGKPQWFHPLKVEPLPPLSRRTVPFPCPDESIGTIILAWRGPPATDRVGKTAVDILLRYLCNDVWSPLRQKFVEIEDQKASDISYFSEPYYELSSFGLSFSGIEHMEEDDDEESDKDDEDDEHEGSVENEATNGDAEANGDGDKKESYLLSGKFQDELMDCVKAMVGSGGFPGGIDAIHVAVKKDRENYLAQLESGTHEAVPYHLLEEIVYAHHGTLVLGEEARGALAVYETLQKKPIEYWKDLLQKLIIESARVEIVAVPDGALAEKYTEEERKALNERVSTVGKEALEKLGKENEERIASIKPDKFTEKDFPAIPNTVNISRWSYSVFRERLDEYILQSVTLETEFVHCTIMLDTKSLTFSQRMMVPLLCELIGTCDILLEDGCYISYTDNARALSEASVTTDHSGVFLGYGNNMADQCVIIHFAAEPDSFAEAAELILQTMYQSEVTTERLSSVSQSIMSNCTEELRDGESILNAATSLIPFVEAKGESEVELPNFVLSNLIGSHPLVSFLDDEFTRSKPRKQFRRSILKRLHDALDELRGLPPSDVFVQITGRNPSVAKKTLSTLWTEKRRKFAPNAKTSAVPIDTPTNEDLPISRRVSRTLSSMLKGRNIERIIGINGIESSFMEVIVDSPVYIGHAEWIPLRVLTEMISRMEGPLCEAVRGSGLSYGVGLYNGTWTGQLALTIDESSSPAAAWVAACNVLRQFREQMGKGSESGLAVDVDTAKAATLFSLHSGRSTPESIAVGCLSRAAIGAPASLSADQAVEEAVEKVTLEILTETFDKHVARLFKDPVNRMAVVTCGQGVLNDTIEAFKKCEWPLNFEERTVESLYPSEVQQFVKSLK